MGQGLSLKIEPSNFSKLLCQKLVIKQDEFFTRLKHLDNRSIWDTLFIILPTFLCIHTRANFFLRAITHNGVVWWYLLACLVCFWVVLILTEICIAVQCDQWGHEVMRYVLPSTVCHKLPFTIEFFTCKSIYCLSDTLKSRHKNTS